MSPAIAQKRTAKQVLWSWIKHVPVVSAIAAYIAFNIASAILMGGFSTLALLTNLFPGIMAWFVSAAYNEPRVQRQRARK